MAKRRLRGEAIFPRNLMRWWPGGVEPKLRLRFMLHSWRRPLEGWSQSIPALSPRVALPLNLSPSLSHEGCVTGTVPPRGEVMRRPRKPAERRRVAWSVHGPILPAGVTRSGLGGLRAHASGGIPGSSASLQSRREARVSGALGFNIAARGAPIRLPLTADGRSLRALRASLAPRGFTRRDASAYVAVARQAAAEPGGWIEFDRAKGALTLGLSGKI